MVTPIDVVVLKCRKIIRTENRALFTEQKEYKISAPSQTVASARITPKVCRGHPQHLAHKVPNFIQIGSLPAEL